MSGFPGQVIEVLHLVVTRDLPTSRAFYTQVLGARVVRETPGMLAFLDLAGASVVLSVPGGPTQDKPTISFVPPSETEHVSAELIIRVRDVHSVYAALRGRGALFLTAPVRTDWETRCYLHDPDGHLIELTEPPTASSAQSTEGATA